MSLRDLFKSKKNSTKTIAGDAMIANDNNLSIPDFFINSMSKEKAEEAKKHNEKIRKHTESNN